MSSNVKKFHKKNKLEFNLLANFQNPTLEKWKRIELKKIRKY